MKNINFKTIRSRIGSSRRSRISRGMSMMMESIDNINQKMLGLSRILFSLYRWQIAMLVHIWLKLDNGWQCWQQIFQNYIYHLLCCQHCSNFGVSSPWHSQENHLKRRPQKFSDFISENPTFLSNHPRMQNKNISDFGVFYSGL